jgi:hypothetical protein
VQTEVVSVVGVRGVDPVDDGVAVAGQLGVIRPPGTSRMSGVGTSSRCGRCREARAVVVGEIIGVVCAEADLAAGQVREDLIGDRWRRAW